MSFRVCTFNPPFLANYSRQSRSPCVAKSGTIYYSYYLAYAGCALEQAGYEVKHIDSIILEHSREDSLGQVVGSGATLVLVDTSTPSIVNDLEICSELKSRDPQIIVCCVGTFPSKNTDEFFRMNEDLGLPVDFALMGEYEESAVELAAYLDSGASISSKIGIVDFRSGSMIGNRESRKTDESFLDSLPFVSEYYMRHFGREGIERHFYASIQWPYLQILTSRGCPYKCTFCNIPSIGSYRKRSVESVVAEFLYIQENLPFVKEIFIEDDTFPIDKKRTIELCSTMIAAGVKITWSCNARVNTDRDVLEIMKKAGCRLTCVGFESPDVDGLGSIIKRTNLSQQKEFVREANSVGIKINGCFILGLPGDDAAAMNRTIEYAKELNTNTAQFYPHMLYPGTESYAWAKRNNLITTESWGEWLTDEGFHRSPLSQNNISPDELLKWCDKARLKFYTNPRYLFKAVTQFVFDAGERERILIAGRSFFPLLIEYWKHRKER